MNFPSGRLLRPMQLLAINCEVSMMFVGKGVKWVNNIHIACISFSLGCDIQSFPSPEVSVFSRPPFVV